jgi:hypothetical protein
MIISQHYLHIVDQQDGCMVSLQVSKYKNKIQAACLFIILLASLISYGLLFMYFHLPFMKFGRPNILPLEGHYFVNTGSQSDVDG